MNERCLAPREHSFVSFIMARTKYIQFNYDDVRFVDQHMYT